MSKDDCIFCKIIDGDIPSAKIFEDDYVYAFLDISQVTKGHTLIIPKTHIKNIYETPEDIASEFFARVPKIANAIKKTYNPIGLNLLNNNEKPADQSVFHLHIHLIPRYGENDGYSSNWKPNTEAYSTENLQTIAKEIHDSIIND